MIKLEKYPKLTSALISAAMGAILFVLIYGFRVLIPTNVDWLMESGDLSQHYYGWRFFNASSWHFPVGLTDTLGYPYMTSVMFTDSIPLFALFFKLFSPILPESFQYFGIWGILCFMLQGAIGALICHKFTNSKLHAVLGSLLFVLSPVVLNRMYYHTALAGHWLILLGILLLLSHKDLATKFKTAMLYWAILGALCASIHQYFLPMCGILCFGYIIYEFIENKRWYAILHGIVFIGSALLIDYFLGAFSVNTQSGASGLGEYSFNLNGFFDPQNYSSIMPSLSRFPSQHEGFAYIGFGIITLSIIAFVIQLYLREKTQRLTVKEWLRERRGDITAYALVTVILVILAVSPVVTFGERVLFTIPISEKILDLWAIFRSTGRLVWPIVYLIIVLGLSILLTRKNKHLVITALCVCALLQFYDLHDIIMEKHQTYSVSTKTENPISESFWQELAETNELKHLVLSNNIASPWNGYLYSFAEVALQNSWTLNDFYFARGYQDIAETWKKSLVEPEEGTVFVMTAEDYESCQMSIPKNLSFYEVDEFIIGLENASLMNLTPMKPTNFTFVFEDNAHMQEGEDINGIRYIYAGGKSYGPYIAVLEGSYDVTIVGENLDLGDIDATMDAGSTQLAINEFTVSSELVTFQVDAPINASDLETRILNNSEKTIIIRSLTIAPSK